MVKYTCSLPVNKDAPQAAGATSPARSYTPIIAAQPTRETIVVLTLDEREIALLEALLTQGRSRPLARRIGHDRETLKRWQDGLRLKIQLAMRKDSATMDASARPPH